MNNHTKFLNRILNIEQLDLSPGNLNSYWEKCPQIFAEVKKTLVERKIFLSWFEKNWFDKKKTQICRVSEEIYTIWKFWIQYFISIIFEWIEDHNLWIQLELGELRLIRNGKSVFIVFYSGDVISWFDYKLSTFTVETIVNQFPVEKIQAVMAVDWSGTVERLLGEGVAVIIHNRLLYIPHSDISSAWNNWNFLHNLQVKPSVQIIFY